MRIRKTTPYPWPGLYWLMLFLPLFCVMGCGGDEEPSQSTTTPTSTSDSDNVEPPNPPQITDVTVAEITRTGVTIRWKTDIPATSQVEYGETTSYGKKSRLNARFVTEHEALLEALDVCVDYHFRVLSAPDGGEPAFSEDDTFTSSPPTFAEDILPVFQVSCMLGVRCHAEVVGLSALKLTTYDLMTQGGVNGNPIVPGDAGASLLVQRITGQKPPQMPLDNPALKQEQLDLIKKWIDTGARQN